MNRRSLLIGAALAPLARCFGADFAGFAQAADTPDLPPTRRVRPSDPGWPSAASWNRLNQQTGGRLIEVKSPLEACRDAPFGDPCRNVFKEMKNPYYIRDEVALTQTTGWVDAWTSAPSVYAVAARTTGDVVAAVNFAREKNLRLVVKGGGHSYLGTSNAADSLLIWTRFMDDITLHDGFVAEGCSERPQPAVTVGAGAIWMHTYNEVTTKGGRYVQGGGCGTVGVAGLVQGGGFGSYSKNYGTSAASLLEAEIVTADGIVRIANACTNPDLFWALKGGGGGTFGVVTRLTLRTRELPDTFGFVSMTIEARSAAAFGRLLTSFVGFYFENLHNPHWGEIVNVRPGNRLDIQLSFQGLDKQQADALWQPFLQWVIEAADDFTFTHAPSIRVGPARMRWDAAAIKARAPAAILSDDRPGAPADNVFWAANLSEAGHFIHGFESLWLPASLLQADQQSHLAEALQKAAAHSTVELHFQKGLAGATAETIAAARNTATNPAVINAFALAIVASEAQPAYPGMHGHEPDLADARKNARAIASAIGELKKIAPDTGSYVAESSFFEEGWQKSYWGANYPKLLDIKNRCDPDGLFFVHHGVGSEAWSADGFVRLPQR
ncbi:FAD/FMN-containing dehydrogenase [Bradyrhizobium lablabi]|uniref:FAD/FMN-containing dehydrogenase n=1 Tax=Bradyrhizobium lablabi TaxID=722472 RepID=A0A1M6Y0B3_9BRAD|nr:FAD-dependent oxidoreductase [Bradyrhizobium lablabi]SHL11712.1 FAD/FMN-containing dehydrogenase [Bradyrhizobium lablabi]